MSLVGCNFTCKNDDCNYFDTGFTITGSWPLGYINDIIDKTEDEHLISNLIKKRDAGYEYSKINYPDPYNILIAAYSIEKFCLKCKRIQTFESGSEEDTCHVCGDDYLSFHQAAEDGIPCPSCGVDLQQVRWYVQIAEEESSSEESEES